MKKLKTILAVSMIAVSSQVSATDGDFNKVDYALKRVGSLSGVMNLMAKMLMILSGIGNRTAGAVVTMNWQCYTDRHKTPS